MDVTYTAAQLADLRAILIFGFLLSCLLLVLENWSRSDPG